MPQKHPFAIASIVVYCKENGLDKKKLKARRERMKRLRDLYESAPYVRDNFRRRVKMSVWNALGLVRYGFVLPPADGRHCLCPNCSRAARLPVGRPPKDVGAAKLRAYKQKRQDDNA